MKNALLTSRIFVTGMLVKTYFLVSVACVGAKGLYKNHRSQKMAGFYSKLISAEIMAYMLLQHFRVF